MEKRYFEVSVKKYVEDADYFVYRPASLDHPKNHAVMFVTEGFMDHADALLSCEHCLVFWPQAIAVPRIIQKSHAVFLCKNPHKEYCRFYYENKITNLPELEEGDYKNGYYIAKSAMIGNDCKIFPGAYIGGDVEIGDNCYIGSGVKLIGDLRIGNNVVIRENSVLGADGLSTDRDESGKAITMPQFGCIVVEDDVQIGANVVIARGAIDETRIYRGVKIDNCVFISHNVKINEDSFIVGESIMFGSSSVGKKCLISGNSILMNAVHVGDESIVGAGAVVVKSIPAHSKVKGNPAR